MRFPSASMPGRPRARAPVEPVDVIVDRLRVVAGLGAALDGAEHVQECAPERVDLKRELFRRLDAQADEDASLASSSSFLPASQFADALPGRARWVARLLAASDDPALPWHRVVRSDGRIAFPAGSEAWREQARRLGADGVRLAGGRVRVARTEHSLDAEVWGPA